MEQTALALRGQTVISTMDDVERAATAMAKSGYFQDSRDMAQAVVKILAGQEMGFGPFASMTGVYIISGRPSIGANLMAAAVKKSGRYNYRVIEMTEAVCRIEYFEQGKSIGVSSFTLDEARKAGTKNLDKYPRNMLFARAMSNGCRWYCPDVFNGSPVYTPEELGANVNEEGEVIDVPFTTTTQPTNGNGKAQPKPAAQPEPEQPPANAEVVYPDELLTAIGKQYELHPARVKSTLKYSNLPVDCSTGAAMTWMATYKANRDAGMTPQEAAAAANG